MKISKNFSLEEFTFSRTALQMGINNDPPEEVVENIIRLTRNVLQPLRDELSSPIYITSGYRSYDLNKAVGGVSDSQHLTGEAVDFIVPNYEVEELFLIISLEYPYDQVIREPTWIHLSYSDNLRYERFRTKYKNGRITYIPVPNINKQRS